MPANARKRRFVKISERMHAPEIESLKRAKEIVHKASDFAVDKHGGLDKRKMVEYLIYYEKAATSEPARKFLHTLRIKLFNEYLSELQAVKIVRKRAAERNAIEKKINFVIGEAKAHIKDHEFQQGFDLLYKHGFADEFFKELAINYQVMLLLHHPMWVLGLFEKCAELNIKVADKKEGKSKIDLLTNANAAYITA
ncbi:MAG: hypothetical protein Q7K42_00390, partial [Candidatus Diapherotrites archaeon]|nr:hypothetical protein [Candidatus Diapherotrites archaeon]